MTVPHSFAELVKTSPDKGRCGRCKAPGTVRLSIVARPMRSANGGVGTPTALAKNVETLCEPCAVELYLEATTQ